MPTNLLIGHADIPGAATSSSVTLTEDPMYPHTNLFGGNRTDYFTLESSSASDNRIACSLPSGTKSCNFIYIGNADLLKQANVQSIVIKGNSTNDYATAATVKTISSFSSATLSGPAEEDYIESFSPSTGYRYWFVNYTSSGSSSYTHSKLFFGTAFDPGIDPNAPATITRIRLGSGQRRAIYGFEFSWNGMSYSKAVEMYNTFYKTRRHKPVILFTTSWHDILMGNKVVLCRITDMSMPPRVTDYCDVSATFEELI